MKTLTLGRVLGVLLLVVMVLSPLAILAQGRNAEEQEAWNIYRDYKKGKENIQRLEIAIQRGNQDQKDISYGFGAPFAIDPNNAASIARAKEMIAHIQQKQAERKAAWDKKFWGNYGDLDDCDKYIVDEKTKKKMDTIEFRLTYFPFKSGVVSGYELFFNGKRVGYEPSWTMEQAVANLEGNIKNHPDKKVEGRYNGKPITPPSHSGYELFFDGKRVGFEPTWSMEQAAANLEGNIKNHPDKKVEGRYNGKPIILSTNSSNQIAGLWDTTIPGSVRVQLEFQGSGSGWTGRFFGFKGWENMADLAVDPVKGTISWRRPLAWCGEPDQRYTAVVTGTTMTGNFLPSTPWTGKRIGDRIPN